MEIFVLVSIRVNALVLVVRVDGTGTAGSTDEDAGGATDDGTKAETKEPPAPNPNPASSPTRMHRLEFAANIVLDFIVIQIEAITLDSSTVCYEL